MAEEAPGSASEYFEKWETRGKALRPMSDQIQRCSEPRTGVDVASTVHVGPGASEIESAFADACGSGDVELAPATAEIAVAVAAPVAPAVAAAVATAAECEASVASHTQMAYWYRAVAEVAVAQTS